ncbi:hypothetical protein [Paraburkholderia aspalathi]|nr:hypothetical protein [Paraburkholderia aspalathi]
MDAIIVPAVLGLTEWAPTLSVASVQRLRAACLAHLHGRIAEPLEPPADFARVNTVSCRCVHCAELGRFLVDPGRKEWALKAAQHARNHVESAIRQHGCDLDCATRRVGSPHSLICTKNQASYERRVRQRKDDLRNAERLDVLSEHG